MLNLAGTKIFWWCLVEVTLMTFLFGVLGRSLLRLLPFRQSSLARFYLSPLVGLALVTIWASMWGRFYSFASWNLVALPLLFISCLCLIFEMRQWRSSLKYFTSLAVFNFVCGASLFFSLYLWGAYDTHNDTFTYLVHGQWLQNHAFKDLISSENVTAYSTQIRLYQLYGFRMGASFLLGFMQRFFGFENVLFVYPALMIVILGSTFLSLGFPLFSYICRFQKKEKWMLLSLPAFSLGGIIFGANFGFLPQTLGLSFAATFAFFFHNSLKNLIKTKNTAHEWFVPIFISSLLLACTTFAYSEFSPFIGLSTLLLCLTLMVLTREYFKIAFFSTLTFLLSLLILNTEIKRVVEALKTQSSAVVGVPLDWSLFGFIAHAMGFQGGAFDYQMQWSNTATFLQVFLVGVLIYKIQRHPKLSLTAKETVLNFLPSFIMLSLFLAGLFYFRYFAKNPFQVGVGQSWSQFKLTDWAHIYTTPLLLLLIISGIQIRYPRKKVLSVIFICLLFFTGIAAHKRTESIRSYYGSNNIAEFYETFPQVIFKTCRPEQPIYLELGGHYNKFRQIASLLLKNASVKANWTGDDYIYYHLPKEKQVEQVQLGDCIVQPLIGPLENDSRFSKIGKFKVGPFTDKSRSLLAVVEGGYPREMSEASWWHLVDGNIKFLLPDVHVLKPESLTKIRFGFKTLENNQISFKVLSKSGKSLAYSISSTKNIDHLFEQNVPIPISDISELSFSSTGPSLQLAPQDDRKATMAIKDLELTQEILKK